MKYFAKTLMILCTLGLAILCTSCTVSQEQAIDKVSAAIRSDLAKMDSESEDLKLEIGEVAYAELPSYIDVVSDISIESVTQQDNLLIANISHTDYASILTNCSDSNWIAENIDVSEDSTLNDALTIFKSSGNTELPRAVSSVAFSYRSFFGTLTKVEILPADAVKLRSLWIPENASEVYSSAIETVREQQVAIENANREAEYQSILISDPIEISIEELLALYDGDSPGYDALMDKHIRLTAYYKDTTASSDPFGVTVPAIAVDGYDMKSFFGSYMLFSEETKLPEIGLCDKVVIEGIGDTSGVNFKMHHCVLVSNEATNPVDYTTSISYESLDVEDAARFPDRWRGRYVEVTGTISQVMSPSLFSWHTRYVIPVGNFMMCFYSDSSENFVSGDNVTVRGIVKGTMSAENFLNDTHILPDVEAIEVIRH